MPIFGKRKIKTRKLRDAYRGSGEDLYESSLGQEDFLGEQYAQGRAGYAPYTGLGERAAGDISSGLDTGAFDPGEFVAPTMEEAMKTPGYQFRLSQGERAIRRRLAAQGLGNSGAHLVAALQHGQGLASEEYDKVYSRAAEEYNLERTRLSDNYDRLSGLADRGFSGAQDLAGLGQAYGRDVINTRRWGEEARARGNIGAEQIGVADQAYERGGGARQGWLGFGSDVLETVSSFL